MGSNLDDAKGRAKEALGDATDDEDMKREGAMDRAGASVKEMGDKAKDAVHGAVDSVKDKMRH